MTNLNTKIHSTVTALQELGFECNNEDKLSFLLNLNELDHFKREFYSLSFKHKDHMLFAHFEVNYESKAHYIKETKVTSVKVLIIDSNSQIATGKMRYNKVSNNVTKLSEKVNALLPNAQRQTEATQRLKASQEKINNEKNSIRKFIVDVFGEDASITFAKTSVTVNYKKVDLEFDLKNLVDDFSNLQTKISFGWHSRFISAGQAKALLDTI